MTLTLFIVFALGVSVAYANGANDVSKGIATLVGSGVASYRRAVLWGVIWTGVGGITGAFLAQAMVQTFGKDLLAPGRQATIAAAVATIAGAALWVGIATLRGLPVSTTHAIVGSIAGVASLAHGLGGVNWPAFVGKIILPLLLSPIVSLGLTVSVLGLWRQLAPNTVTAADCVCLDIVQPAVEVGAGGSATLLPVAGPRLHVGTCAARHSSGAAMTLNKLHWLTSGATSLARGLNDAPKMVALLVGAAVLSGGAFHVPLAYFTAITVGMLAGSWIAGRRVTEVLACKVTRMDHIQGLVANLITAALVGPGAAIGLPMSTTHVASGAIIGVAAGQGAGANRRMIRDMLLAWLVTAPAAAAFGIAVLTILRVFRFG